MSYDTYGGDHKNVIFSMPQASSRESFMKKGSQDIICNIPKRLVNTSQFEEIENGVERNGAIKKAEFKRKRWIIESLVRQDVKVKGIIKDIAREELGMVVMTKGMT
jgi:metal-dependent hydrolase (beta-lactamase superfamily II)